MMPIDCSKLPTKYCKSCNFTKYRYEFGQRLRTRDGLSEYCSSCTRERKKKSHEKHHGLPNPNPYDFRNFNIKKKKK